jgi:FMN hydrolase / 5-amino-6-(5-phospho-D-ribitylamino)uracil phosphatase
MWRSLQAVSFDLDNTLWDVEPVLQRAEQVLRVWLAAHCPRLAARYDDAAIQELRRELAARHPARAHDLTWLRTEALRQCALRTHYPETVAGHAFAVFHEARNQIDPYPDVRPALARLAQRFPLYALSNGNADVRRVGLGDLFAGAIGAEAAGAAKPDPRIFQALLARAALAPPAVLHVGDDPHSDIAGARRVGMRTAWVNRRGADWPVSVPRPDLEVRDLAELVRLLE